MLSQSLLMLLLANPAILAQTEPGAPNPASVAPPSYSSEFGIIFPGLGARGCPLTLDELKRKSWCELEQLYRQSPAGCIPNGYATGRVIYCPEKHLSAVKGHMAELWWKGKHFNGACGTLVNQWAAGKAVRAKVYYGPSRMDGKPAIVMDYADSWPSWRDTRDEMREVAPGLFLGAMYLHSTCTTEPKYYFAVQIQCN